MIGAFQQPQVVMADMSQLKTLPDRELSAGLAEVIKYALLGDRDFLEWLEQHMDQLVAQILSFWPKQCIAPVRIKPVLWRVMKRARRPCVIKSWPYFWPCD